MKRQITIGFADERESEIDGLMEAAPTFGLRSTEAESILAEVFAATEGWRRVANANGIPEQELARMGDAFEGLRDATS